MGVKAPWVRGGGGGGDGISVSERSGLQSRGVGQDRNLFFKTIKGITYAFV